MTLVKINHRGHLGSPFFQDLLLSGLSNSREQVNQELALPKVNISEDEAQFFIELAAPGLKRDDFQINLKKDTLSISTVKEREETNRFTRQEFDYSNFSRSFNMPEAADTENINASYLDGILKITINKRDENSLQKRIAVS